MGDECQEHSADVDTVELQQDEQMPVAELGIVVDKKEDRNGSGMIHYLLALLIATRGSIRHLLLLSLLMLPIFFFRQKSSVNSLMISHVEAANHHGLNL
jgi:hypothetical protein